MQFIILDDAQPFSHTEGIDWLEGFALHEANESNRKMLCISWKSEKHFQCERIDFI